MNIHRFIHFLPVLLVAACASPKLDILRSADMPEDPYVATLALQYRTLAESARGNSRWEASRFYAEKGLKALYGKGDVAPEDPGTWPLGAGDKEALAEARARLTQALSEPAKKNAPRAAANALVFYDCWLEQTSAGEEDAAICEQGFQEAMTALTKPAAPVEAQTLPADVPLSTSYLIFFGWDEASLNASAKEAISKTLAYIQKLRDKGYEVVVNGHTDTSGDDSYNLILSNARADVVKQALIAAGIVAEKITTFGFGESDPRVKTPDGVREPANRRVEIFIE